MMMISQFGGNTILPWLKACKNFSFIFFRLFCKSVSVVASVDIVVCCPHFRFFFSDDPMLLLALLQLLFIYVIRPFNRY